MSIIIHWEMHSLPIDAFEINKLSQFHTRLQMTDKTRKAVRKTLAKSSRSESDLRVMRVCTPINDKYSSKSNLVPRVLSLPRESTLVAAGHVSMYTNQIRIA